MADSYQAVYDAVCSRAQPSEQLSGITGQLTGGGGVISLVNAAVDDLSIAPGWHSGKSRGEVEFIRAVFQNGVEVAADAILAALSEGQTA